MTISRRDFLKLTGLVATSTALASCSPLYALLAGKPEPPLPLEMGTGLGAFPALSRLTFGPRTDECARVSEIGLSAWIEEQLAPETLDDDACDWRIRKFDVLEMSAGQLRGRADKILDDYDPSLVVDDFLRATLLRQIYSSRQLYELMVEFWSDHFNISMQKGDCWFLKIVDDREVIRKHALGNFRDLLQASAHSPAMLVYLDNQSNLKGAPNENYAREVMELHTLGVDGGYTQNDVMELARCFTGWTVKERFSLGEFTFDESLHDTGAKLVLGNRIKPSGQSEAESVLDALVEHPATARNIATKLVRRFIADDPPPGMVERAAWVFAQTQGDIQSVLRTILFEGLDQLQPKFKRPLNFVASSLRILGAQTDGGFVLQEALRSMGQTPFSWPTPDGYPDMASAWMGNLLPRWKFAIDFATDQIDGTQIDIPQFVDPLGAHDIESWIDGLTSILLGKPLATSMRSSIARSLRAAGAHDDLETASVILAGILASPAFQWR